MDWKPVVSSIINEVGYDPLRQTLDVLFRSGARYYFYWVSDSLHSALMDSDSKGTFLRKHIQGHYQY